MKQALTALNTLVDRGVICQYAIGGAIAASFYIEATATEDIDVFVVLQPASGSQLLSLIPIYDELKKLGGVVQGEYIKLGNWPVQILPAYKQIIEDALEESVVVEYHEIPTRIFTAEYLCAIALDTKRMKDYYRVGMFIEQEAVDVHVLKRHIEKYGLEESVKKVINWKNPDENKPTTPRR